MSRLRGRKPAEVAKAKRLKLFMFGLPGSGKTTAATMFPRPYLIDTERGAENEQYIKALEDRGGAIFQTSDFEEMVAEVLALISESHEYQTLIIDPITTVFHDLAERAEAKVGSEFGRHYSEAGKRMKHLINLLYRLDMNVVITSHAKAEYGDGMQKIGTTFDAWKKIDYVFDLVLELQKRGQKRVAIPRKSRLDTFPEDEQFEFSYEAIADRYGREDLERAAKAVALADDAQVDRLKKLLAEANETEDRVAKFLAKYSAENFSELPAEAIERAINHYDDMVGKAKKEVA